MQMVWMGRTRIVEVVEEKLREDVSGARQRKPAAVSREQLVCPCGCSVRHWNMVAEAIGGRWTDHAGVRGLGVISRQAGGGRVT